MNKDKFCLYLFRMSKMFVVVAIVAAAVVVFVVASVSREFVKFTK